MLGYLTDSEIEIIGTYIVQERQIIYYNIETKLNIKTLTYQQIIIP